MLCMAPTEYRVIAKRADLHPVPSLRGLVAAGEALNPEVLRAFQEATGLEIRDGYGQTETGQLTGVPAGGEVRPGSMGRPLPGVDARDRRRRARPRRPPHRPHLLRRLRSTAAPSPEDRPWRTGDRVTAGRGRLPLLRGADRRRHHLGRLPDRPLRGRVGPRLPRRRRRGRRGGRARRGARRGRPGGRRAARRLRPSPELASELQDHVKRETAPYKYPRIVDFAAELPKTASGKVQRAVLRGARRTGPAPRAPATARR